MKNLRGDADVSSNVRLWLHIPDEIHIEAVFNIATAQRLDLSPTHRDLNKSRQR